MRPKATALVLLPCLVLVAGCNRAVGEDTSDASPGPDVVIMPDAGPLPDAVADAEPGPDAEPWWYDCFEPGEPLCGRDAEWPEPEAELPSQWASTPILPMGSTDFHVLYTQTGEPEPLPSHMQDATWLGAVELLPPHVWDTHGHVPTAVIHLDAAVDGPLELAVALDAGALAFIPPGEPLVLVLYRGLEVVRASDGVLLFALVDRVDVANAEEGEMPTPRVMDSAGLDFAVTTEPYCFGAEGQPIGNRQFAFDTLLVKGGATDEVLDPGDTREITTPVGTYRVGYVAAWHRVDSAYCTAQYADGRYWRVSYEVLRIP